MLLNAKENKSEVHMCSPFEWTLDADEWKQKESQHIGLILPEEEHLDS